MVINKTPKEMILVICPSRNRPQECGRMIDSFLKTSTMSTLSICLDNDDPKLDEYRDIIGSKVPYTVTPRKTTTQIINDKWMFSSEHYKWFSVTNDDFVYKTLGWDFILTSKIRDNGRYGIAFGNDLLAGAHLPTTSVISREIVTALGWLQLPTLTHLFGDNVWQEIGKRCGCIHYCKDVIIEHHHVFANKMQKDATFLETNSPLMYTKDNKAFTEWLLNQSKQDVSKIKIEVLENDTRPIN